MKARKLVNPGRKKRKLSPLQKLFFGSKRVRAAAKAAKGRKRVSNPRKAKPKGLYHDSKGLVKRYKTRSGVRKAWKKKGGREGGYYIANPSRIMTVSIPGLSNPGKGRKKTVARKSRKTRKVSIRRRRRVSNPFKARRVHQRKRYTRRRRLSNPVTYHRRRRVHNRRRRNPSRSSVLGGAGKIGAMFAGGAVTHFVTNMLPASFTQGFLGYITTALVAVTQGKVVGSITKKPGLGNAMTLGGFFYLGLKVVGDFVPSVGAMLPFSLRGMGLIAPSSFYVPQVNRAGSMGTFIRPSAVPAYVPVSAGMKGIIGNAGYAPARRQGRLH